MPDPLAVNPDDMVKDGGAFTLIGSTATDIVREAREGLNGLGNYWGTHSQDPVALTYGKNMVPNEEGLFDSVDGLGTGFTLTGVDLSNNAVTYRNTDLNNAESVPGLHLT